MDGHLLELVVEGLPLVAVARAGLVDRVHAEAVRPRVARVWRRMMLTGSLRRWSRAAESLTLTSICNEFVRVGYWADARFDCSDLPSLLQSLGLYSTGGYMVFIDGFSSREAQWTEIQRRYMARRLGVRLWG
jgi:hypothetical protein